MPYLRQIHKDDRRGCDKAFASLLCSIGWWAIHVAALQAAAQLIAGTSYLNVTLYIGRNYNSM